MNLLVISSVKHFNLPYNSLNLPINIDVYLWLVRWKMKKDVFKWYIIVKIMAFVHLIYDVQQCPR
jgi:hypothetical protein